MREATWQKLGSQYIETWVCNESYFDSWWSWC